MNKAILCSNHHKQYDKHLNGTEKLFLCKKDAQWITKQFRTFNQPVRSKTLVHSQREEQNVGECLQILFF
jgi:hypothetical protein